MNLTEIVAPSMKELFIEAIENMILSGELKIGDKLPTEREMADQMKVSRTIVNLGLNELQNKGFIEIIPRKGTYVADYIRKGRLETLLSIINHNGGNFDKKTFYSLMEFRIINEGAGAYLAALNRTDSDIELMEELYENMLSEGSFEEISKVIFDFHHAVFCATGNYIYPLVHNAFENISIVLTSVMFKYFEVKETTDQIKIIIEKIKEKDAQGAKKAMENLINRGIENLEKNYFSY
ncbi:DNA-binding transcriptional regulator, FadR family [Clostridium amylolyticum]|uniref:DNA-binding transcriptional regulator, FadR family n=1 Tax=Clostridium amylolyticum TaxID=1121298 RepID=A0A1M6BXE9_9CLOT|nr:GntR family transcriptional regulator [Clostridium amylolyticum]SHI53452.1 DNA-binding transcriptional regulator, FadR family [Clostridium amylolyticum]